MEDDKLDENQVGGRGIIGLVGVKGELDAIVRAMTVVEERRVGGAMLRRGTLHVRQVVVVETGIGKVNAAAATQMLIDAIHPDSLLFSGTAGSLSPELQVGDVVIADAVAVHDAGACRQDGFDPTGIALLNGTGRHCSARRLLSSTEMRDLATKVAARIPWGLSRGGLPPRVHAGTIVTGDQVIFSAEKKEWLRNTFDAVAVEMEGSAFAQVAEANGVPWLLIRAVSDQADHYLDFPFELWRDYVDDAQTPRAQLERTIQRLSYVAMNPKTPLKAKRFLSLLNYAANNAARLTEAVVAAL